MVKIRLMRIGAKKRPFYRIVVVDERKKRSGAYIDSIGTYNPLTNPKEIIINKEKLELWTKQGAILSDGYLRITKQAPQKPPRKPKKEKKETPTPAPEAKVEEAKTEEAPVEEAVEAETQTESEAPTKEATEEPTEAPVEEAPVEEVKTEEEAK